MHIIGLVAENVKKIRAVTIEPTKAGLIQITGRNGQGKTSVLDAIWYGLVGKKALPEKPVRKGAEKARIKLDLGELIVTRTILQSGAMTLNVQGEKGSKFTSPQQVLDELLGQLTFDPLAFIHMKKKEQVNALRSVVKLEIDVDALNAQNAEDFNKRREINRDVDRLRGEVNAITVQAGLPAEKIDEQPFLDQLQSAGVTNQKAQKVNEERGRLEMAHREKHQAVLECGGRIETQAARVEDLQKELERAQAQLENLRGEMVDLRDEMVQAQETFDAAPAGQFVDVTKLTVDLQQAQAINREIEKRIRRDAIDKDLKEKEKQSHALTRAMEDREETKRTAIAEAKMPIDGLAFDEEAVMYNGIPLDQLGEAEQIRISTSIAMAANPKLRILRIEHGEALDDDALAALAELAEQNDFQIWMARVDSSGKVGIVMEDGMVKSPEEE